MGIKDNNGVAILSLHATDDADYDSNVFTITLPMGKSCDGLEMRAKAADAHASPAIGAGGTITKTVDKHNNGKVFKITRSFLQVEEADIKTGIDGTPTKTGLTVAAGKGHSALEDITTIVIGEPDPALSCAVKAATDYAFPVLRTVSLTHGGAAAAITHTD